MDENPVSVPMTPPIAPPAPRPETPRTLVITLVALMVIVILGVAGYAYFRTSVSVEPKALPEELSHALFLNSITGQLYSYASGSFSPVAAKSGSKVLDAVVAAGHQALLLEDAQGAFSIEVDGTSVASSKRPMGGVTFSPDGTMLAYAVETRGDVASKNSADWDVVILNRATGKTTTLGSGFSPFFITNTVIIRFSDKGIIAHNLTNGKDNTSNKSPFTDVTIHTAQSPNHQGIAWEIPDKKRFAIFKVTAISPTYMTVLANGSVKLDDTRSFVLSDTTFYAVQASGDEIVLNGVNDKSVSAFDHFYTFPKTVSIDDVIIPSP